MKQLIITSLLLSGLIHSTGLMAQSVIEEWVARYSNTIPRDIALDASGNVYVAGDDFSVIKYDPNGNELWVRKHVNPINYGGSVSSMVVDASGNVYVTGHFIDISTNTDTVIIKYDTQGNELWSRIYNGPADGIDFVDALAVDASGNVYIAGYSEAIGSGDDFVTVKYGINGKKLWVKTYNGPGNGDDTINSIAVDASGNIYVAGRSTGISSGNNFATIKYDTKGNELWVTRYTSGNGDDTINSIAVDASGNIYVTGRSAGIGSGNDFATIKYDTNGNELWVATYNGPGNGSDWLTIIALDPSGNVYVTGRSEGLGTNADYATVKYDTNGNELWVKRYNGPANGDDRPTAMDLDASGNVYITGFSSVGGFGGNDYATVKYDAQGNERWVKRYNIPGGHTESAWGIAVNVSGSVYVTGLSTTRVNGNSLSDIVTIKYSPPVDLTTGLAASIGDSMVTLDWDDNTDPDLADYNVYRATASGGPYGQVASGVLASAYTDTGLVNGTTYYYVVTAVNSVGDESGHSNEVSATPDNLPHLDEPDLVISQLTPKSLTVEADEDLGYRVVVLNQGNKQTESRSYLRLVLSSDQVIDDTDLRLKRRRVPRLDGGESRLRKGLVEIPSDVTPGTYFLGAIADVYNRVNESDEMNNTASVVITITEGDGDD